MSLAQIHIEAVIPQEKLGAITLQYECEACGTVAEVDPTFFEVSGTPVCSDCGEDMTVERAFVEFDLLQHLGGGV